MKLIVLNRKLISHPPKTAITTGFSGWDLFITDKVSRSQCTASKCTFVQAHLAPLHWSSLIIPKSLIRSVYPETEVAVWMVNR